MIKKGNAASIYRASHKPGQMQSDIEEEEEEEEDLLLFFSNSRRTKWFCNISESTWYFAVWVYNLQHLIWTQNLGDLRDQMHS